jgi:hypothetical protein
MGKGGFYVSRDGRVIEDAKQPWWQVLWGKSRLINDALRGIVAAKDRLVETPIVLGGNLVLSREIMAHLPFDPSIPRGEDIDYLINAKRCGFTILFDRKLRITHLHPERTSGLQKAELRGDIERFLYEREKVKGATLSLNPYPGYFLNDTFTAKAMITILLFSLQLFLDARTGDAREVLGYHALLRGRKNDVWERYISFRGEWEKLMEVVEENRDELAVVLQ